MKNQINHNAKDQSQPENFVQKLKEYLQHALVKANSIKDLNISLEEFETFRAAPAIAGDKVKNIGSQCKSFIASVEGKEYLTEIINCVQQLITEGEKSSKNISVDHIDELLNKAVVRMRQNELEKEEQVALHQEQRISSAVKDTITGALSHIKPWKGLS